MRGSSRHSRVRIQQNTEQRSRHGVAACRLYKEHRSYILEEEQQKIKLDKFIAENAEEWDVKNAVREYSYGVLC